MAAHFADEEEIGDIEYDAPVFDLCFHPTHSLVAAALISGQVLVHEYSTAGNTLHFQSQHHQESCRCIEFSQDGAYIFTASADCSVQCVDIQTGVVVSALFSAHSTGINAMTTVPSMGLLATGDDNGCVKLWDLRQQSCVLSVQRHEDYISDLVVVADKNTILASSGDGSITATNWKKGEKGIKQSDNIDEDILCLALLQGSREVMCGTQEGILYGFKVSTFFFSLQISSVVKRSKRSQDTPIFLRPVSMGTGRRLI
eukprot:m.394998 g.394998  ORF g.394998 m.394998 type:complete len:257 (+) comp56382_c1_seq1:182-952(+)